MSIESFLAEHAQRDLESGRGNIGYGESAKKDSDSSFIQANTTHEREAQPSALADDSVVPGFDAPSGYVSTRTDDDHPDDLSLQRVK